MYYKWSYTQVQIMQRKKSVLKIYCHVYHTLFTHFTFPMRCQMIKSLHNFLYFGNKHVSLQPILEEMNHVWLLHKPAVFESMSQPWSLSRPGSPDRLTERCLLLRVGPSRRMLCVWVCASGWKPVRVWHNVPARGWKSLLANRVLLLCMWIWKLCSGGVLDSDGQSDAGGHAGSTQTVTHRLWDRSFQSTRITFIWQETGRFLKTWRKAVQELVFLSSFHVLCFLGLSDRVLQKQDGVFQDLCFL